MNQEQRKIEEFDLEKLHKKFPLFGYSEMGDDYKKSKPLVIEDKDKKNFLMIDAYTQKMFFMIFAKHLNDYCANTLFKEGVIDEKFARDLYRFHGRGDYFVTLFDYEKYIGEHVNHGKFGNLDDISLFNFDCNVYNYENVAFYSYKKENFHPLVDFLCQCMMV